MFREDQNRELLKLLAIWGGAVVAVVGLVVGLTNGKVILGREIGYNWIPMVLVVVLVACDLGFRYLIYGKVQSVSLDVVLFSLVVRLSVALTGSGDAAVNVSLVVILVVCAVLEVVVYAWFRRDYRKVYLKWLQQALKSKIPSEKGETQIAQAAEITAIALETAEPDLWGVLVRDEIAHIVDLVTACGGDTSKLMKDATTISYPKMSFGLRAGIVLGLAVLPVITILVNGLIAR